MPTVIYNPQMTSSAAAPAARSIGSAGPMQQFAPSDSFGVAPINPTAVAQGLGQVAQGVSQLGVAVEKFRIRAATTEAEEALVNFEREKNMVFFDQDTGYSYTQGRTAYDNAQPTIENLTKLQQKYADSLLSDEAREMFSRSSNTMLTRAQQEVMQHASTQFNAWEISTLEARLENIIENASLYWNDPSQRATQLELGRQVLIDLAIIRGEIPNDVMTLMQDQNLSPEDVAKLAEVKGFKMEALSESLQTYNSQFAMSTINAALGVSATAAQQALMENKEMLEAPDLMKVQTQIDQRLATEMVQMNSSAAVNIAGDLVSQFGELPGARTIITEQINAIEDEDLRSRTLREATYQLDNYLRGVSENQAATFEVAERFLMNDGTVDQFIAANPQGWEIMTPAQKRKLESGEVITTEFRTLSGLLNLPQADLARVNPADYSDKLSESDRRYLEGQVRDAITGAPTGQVGRTRNAQVESTITGLFGKMNDMNNEELSRVDSFYALVTAEEAYRQQLKGSPLSSQEFTSMLNDLTRTQVTQGGLFGLLPDRQTNIADIPAQEITPISAILRGKNLPVTGDNLVEIYRQRERMREEGTLPAVGQAGESAAIYSNATGPLRGGYRQ